MINLRVIALIAVCFVITTLHAALNIEMSPEERVNLDLLNDRIANGDIVALSEVLQMRSEIAVPFFEYYIQKGIPVVSAEASKLIANVPGYEDYFKEKLKKLSSERDTEFQRSQVFETLGKIKTAGSVRIAAGYLIDDNIVWPSASDVGAVSNDVLAVNALASVNFPNAPTQWERGPSREDVQQWQIWWRKNQANIVKLLEEARDRPVQKPSPLRRPLTEQATATSHSPAQHSASPSLAATTEATSEHSFPIVAIAIIAAIIAGVIVFLVRRKSR